jgi:PAS domain S-box-containing protein
MKYLSHLLSAPQPADDPSTDELHERINELETENATLRHLDDTLRRNIRLFEALLAHSQDGFLLVTPQLTCLKVAHSVLGNSDRELIGQSLLSIIHPEDAAQVQETFDRLLSGQDKSVKCECRAPDLEGVWHWMEVEMTDLLDDPDVQAIVLNNRNIDKRKQYQAELKALQA